MPSGVTGVTTRSRRATGPPHHIHLRRAATAPQRALGPAQAVRPDSLRLTSWFGPQRQGGEPHAAVAKAARCVWHGGSNTRPSTVRFPLRVTYVVDPRGGSALFGM